MIHGAFCNARSLVNFAEAFAAVGYDVLAPDLRYHTPPLTAADLRALATVSVKDYAEDLRALIETLDEPPILVGHSMGGLIAQILATQISPAALVLLAPSAPWGVLPSHFNEFASGFGLYANGNYWEQALIPTFDVASELTLHKLSAAARRLTFEEMVPESGRAMFEIFQWWLDPARATEVPADRVTCDIFCAAGELDTLNPP